MPEIATAARPLPPAPTDRVDPCAYLVASELHRAGISVILRDSTLLCRPLALLAPDLKAMLMEHKDQVIAFLATRAAHPPLGAAPPDWVRLTAAARLAYTCQIHLTDAHPCEVDPDFSLWAHVCQDCLDRLPPDNPPLRSLAAQLLLRTECPAADNLARACIAATPAHHEAARHEAWRWSTKGGLSLPAVPRSLQTSLSAWLHVLR